MALTLHQRELLKWLYCTAHGAASLTMIEKAKGLPEDVIVVIPSLIEGGYLEHNASMRTVELTNAGVIAGANR